MAVTPLGLWGETDPDELLQWWLRIAAERENWRRIGREHASAVNPSAGVRACAGCCCLSRSCRPSDCINSPPGFGAADHARFLSLRQLPPQQYSSNGSGWPFAPSDGSQPFHLRFPCRHLQGFSAQRACCQAPAQLEAGQVVSAGHAGWPGKEREEFQLQGPSIIEGFRRQGYRTVGSGAVGWFDPATETGRCLTAEFERFFYPGSTWQLAEQLAWIKEQRKDVPPEQPLLLFLNVGETHVPYWHAGALWDRDDNPCVPFQRPSRERRRTCRRRQRACLEYVDALLEPLLDGFPDATIVLTADHGDCWGEDGLWEHGISHRRTLEVPLLMRVRGVALA